MLKKYSYILFLFIAVLFAVPANAQITTPNSSQRQSRDTEKEILASQYYRNREYAKALVLYRELYESNPQQYYYSFYIYCLIQVQEFDEAIKIAKKQVRTNPGMLKYYVDLGYLYNANDEIKKANKQFSKAIELLPANVYKVKELANAFYMRSLMDKAIMTYMKGREMLGAEYSFSMELANLYKVSGNYKAMIIELLNEAEEKPEAAERVKSLLQTQLYSDYEDSFRDLLWEELMRRNQKDADNPVFSEYLLWLSIQDKDFEYALIQAKSLDKRYNEDGNRVFNLGRLCINNQDYNTAVEAFTYLTEKGDHNIYYLSALIGKMKAKYLNLITGFGYEEKDLYELQDEYELTINTYGKFPETIQLMRDLAQLQAYYLNKQDEAIALLEEVVKIPNSPQEQIAECKLDLADMYLFTGEVWEATLLYSQVEKAFKHEPIGHLAKLKNARLTYYIGEFEWAKAQLDVLKAATSKLIANDAMQLSLLIGDNLDADSAMRGLMYFAKAELLSYQNKDDLALQTLDSIYDVNLMHPLFDEVLYKKADIMIKNNDFEAADSLLNRIVVNFTYEILADDALFLRAKLQEEHFANKELAMELYQKLLMDYSGSLFTVEARKRFRKLRGDDI
ncbi:hypothetical protein ACFLRY_02795 [Bacteroidota bacterium]